MNKLIFNAIDEGMRVLILGNNGKFKPAQVTFTSKGHPSLPLVMFNNGMAFAYDTDEHFVIEDNNDNRTRLLLENAEIDE